MARYIDADKLKTRIAPESYFRHALVWWIDLQETEDVAPVVHAHWIADSRDCEYTCSHCGDVWRGDFDLEPYDDHFYYCPNCGAKMDEEVNDA